MRNTTNKYADRFTEYLPLGESVSRSETGKLWLSDVKLSHGE